MSKHEDFKFAQQLMKKAAECHASEDAVRFAQAALNVANAVRQGLELQKI